MKSPKSRKKNLNPTVPNPPILLDNPDSRPSTAESVEESAPQPRNLVHSENIPKMRGGVLTARQLHEQKQAIIAQRRALVDGLPHLFGLPHYAWSRDFFASKNQLCLLVAANQIGKSTVQIRKVIHWATESSLWPTLWPRAPRPRLFWYLLPSKDVATTEVETKWIPEFLPRGEFKTDKKYGWEVEYQARKIHAIHFNSGVSVQFRSYAQGDDTLQTATLHYIAADEEVPESLYSELAMRLAATDGYFSMVFTATLNQDMWKRALEGRGEQELFPDGWKRQVSMYDCQVYADGTPGPWTIDRIRRVEATCKSKTEIDRRVHGRFVTELGRKFGAFDPTAHYGPPAPVPPDWRVYCGVDVGSGQGNHPAAVCFVAVSPDNRRGRVFSGWRGDDEQTTAGDVFRKYIELRDKINLPIVQKCYDPRAKDFGVISQRAGEGFQCAATNHAVGEEIVNTLFANNMLTIDDISELRKLGSELSMLMHDTPKLRAKDDFCDALRYCLMLIPWDWSAIRVDNFEEKEIQLKQDITEKALEAWRVARRRGEVPFRASSEDGWGELESEFDYWNEAYG